MSILPLVRFVAEFRYCTLILLDRVKKLNKHLYPGSCFFGPKEKLISLSAKFCQGADILRSKVILNLKSTLSVQVVLNTKVTTKLYRLSNTVHYT